LALCLEEPGQDEVRKILESGEAWIAAVSWIELRIKLERLENGSALLALFSQALAGVIEVTREVADAGYEVRKATRTRVPMIDSLIAGTARGHGMELVHRDAHFAAIPAKLLKQRMLPAK
jgi:predicted nucleic acid-binding protein